MNLTLVDSEFEIPEGVGWGFQVAENGRAVVTFYDEEEKGYSLWETKQVNTTTTFIEYLTSKCVLFHNFFGLLSLKHNFDHMILGQGC